MNIKNLTRSINASKKNLRNFGYLFCGVFMFLGIINRENPQFFYIMLVVGVLFFAVSVLIPTLLKPFYMSWMSMALVLGTIMSTVLLSILFFVGLTTTGLIARLFNKKFLQLDKDNKAKTYWVSRDYTVEKSMYDKQ